MTSLTSVDLSNNFIIEVPSSVCTLTENGSNVDLTQNFGLNCNTLPDCNLTTNCP